MTPATMRARHIDTREWHVLTLSWQAAHFGMAPDDCYNGDEGKPVDLADYDSFEAPKETIRQRAGLEE